VRRIFVVSGCIFCAAAAAYGQYNVLTFHGNPQRTGWISEETILTPARVSSGAFGPIWNSPQLDPVTVGGVTYPPHLYASPLYVDRVKMSGGSYAGSFFQVVYAASSNGFVYAVNASARERGNYVPPGTILWKTSLNTPTGSLDAGIPFGVLGTQAIDLNAQPARLYVASADAVQGWQVFALDITSGKILPGWPLTINNATLAPINQNGSASWQGTAQQSQRGGLNLSPDGRLLYVPFGAYNDLATGWMVSVDTVTPAIASAFSGAPSSVASANAGMWASGGPAVDEQGNVFSTTGNGTTDTTNVPGYWGQSVLMWGPGAPLKLAGTYTPWNYCQMDLDDADLSGSAVVILPDRATLTTTPHLITFGGKQGNQYLVDRDHMPGSLVSRLPCGTDSTLDKSLMPPGPQPQFGQRGPLNVFGPYSEVDDSVDYAKGRSTAAFFRAGDGSNFLYVTGSSKAAADSVVTVPPCIVKLRIVLSPGSPAYLAVEASENMLGFLSPGSPWVTSNGANDAIVWVLCANLGRSASLADPAAPHPILYALDPVTLKELWSSTPSMLNVGGKYNTPGFGRGTVFVGTDRIQAFGFLPEAPRRRSLRN
jgi:hypothetical protein